MLSPEQICLLGCAKWFFGLSELIVGTACLYSDSFSEHVWVSHAHSHALSKKVWTNFPGIMPEENGEDSKHTNGFARKYIQIT